MLDIIAATFPRLVAALRRTGCSRSDAAGLILAARFGERDTAWSATDCARARRIIAHAVSNRPRLVRLDQWADESSRAFVAGALGLQREG